MSFEAGLFIGVLIGGCVGVIVAALCVAAKRNPCDGCAINVPEADRSHCFSCREKQPCG